MNIKEETIIRNEISIALIKYMFDLGISIRHLPEVSYYENKKEARVSVIVHDYIDVENVKRLTERTIDGYRITPELLRPRFYEDHEYVKIEFVVKKVE